VAPYENKKPNVKVRVLGEPQIGSSNLQLEILENGKTKYIGYSF